jgi:hypothetical protein
MPRTAHCPSEGRPCLLGEVLLGDLVVVPLTISSQWFWAHVCPVLCQAVLEMGHFSYARSSYYPTGGMMPLG